MEHEQVNRMEKVKSGMGFDLDGIVEKTYIQGTVRCLEFISV